jgi:hypothetical protein
MVSLKTWWSESGILWNFLQHLYNICVAFVQHLCGICATFVQHLCGKEGKELYK